ADQEAEIGIRSIAVPLVRFDGRAVAALNIGVQPEQMSAKAMIADYLPLLLRETTALRERLYFSFRALASTQGYLDGHGAHARHRCDHRAQRKRRCGNSASRCGSAA